MNFKVKSIKWNFSMSNTCLCNICNIREVEFPSKAALRKGQSTARCSYCKARYDANGKSFIIASDIYKFTRRGIIVYIWVCDKRVSDIKGTLKRELEGLTGQDHNMMMDYMKTKQFKLEDISYAII